MKIKSIISLLCVALGTFVFQACDDVPAPYDIPQQGSASIYGSGTLDEPYSVQGASLNQSGGYAWVKGYIVGYIPLASSDNESYTISDVVFATDGAATSNIVIADDADETDINSCMAVQLPSGDVRSALNLSDHPENIGQAVFLYGTMERYYGASGVKNVTAAILNGEEIGDMPEEETEAIFSADFTSSLGDFTSISASGSLTWYNDYSSAMITGYQNSSNTAGVTYLVSPSIDLSQVTEAYMTINMALNYERGDINTNNAVLVSKDYTGDVNTATWTQLEYDTNGLNSDFTFVEKEMNIPSEFMGGSIVVAFRHTCSETYSSTWEVSSIQVLAGSADTTDDDDTDDTTGDVGNVTISVNGATITMTDPSVTASGNNVTTTNLNEFGWDYAGTPTGAYDDEGTEFIFAQEGGYNPPLYYTNTNGVRMYALNSLTLQSTKPIAQVVLYCDSYGGTNYVGNDQLYATIDGYNWIIVNDYTSNSGGTQLRIQTIEITYAE